MKNTKGILSNIKNQIKEELNKVIVPKHIVFNINTISNYKIDDWANWQNLLPVFDNLLNELNLNNQACIRTFQSFEFENKWLGFGRMKWNLESNKKWTEKYKSTDYSDKKLEFHNTEIWSPDWNLFYKKDELPKFFANIYSEDINNGITIVFNKSLFIENEGRILYFIEEVRKIISDAELVKFERYWKPSSGFVNNIEDTSYKQIIDNNTLRLVRLK